MHLMMSGKRAQAPLLAVGGHVLDPAELVDPFRGALAAEARSAKNRKYSAPRSAADDMNRMACPVSTDSTIATSSARATMTSATRCRMRLLSSPGLARHSSKLARAAAHTAATSAHPRGHVDEEHSVDGRGVGARLSRRAGRGHAVDQVQCRRSREPGQMPLGSGKIPPEAGS